MRPLTPSSTSSLRLEEVKNEGVEISDAFWKKATAKGRTHQAKSNEHTGSPQPNISTIFIGRSRADELE